MANLDALWVLPKDIDEDLVLEDIDPEDAATLADYEAALAACEVASQTLWALSGRKFHSGVVNYEQYVTTSEHYRSALPSTVRGAAVWSAEWGAYFIDPYDWGFNRITLRSHPVKQILEVRDIETGRAFAPAEYTLQSQSVLRVHNGAARGIEVSYRYGNPAPAAGRMAAIALARQFFLLWSGREDECQLPDRVTSVARQGVSWVLLDNQDFLDELKTGIYAVDLFLRSVNPDKARAKAKVFSVDLPRGRRRL